MCEGWQKMENAQEIARRFADCCQAARNWENADFVAFSVRRSSDKSFVVHTHDYS